MRSQLLAILFAQWCSFRNHFPKSDAATVATVIVALLWYGLWSGGAFAVGLICREADPVALQRFLPGVLLLAILYWQLIPILMASTGQALEIRKLIVYPIPHAELFALEVFLRVTAAVEMMIMSAGAFGGLLLNHRIPVWGPLSIIGFVVFNLALSAGLRDLLGRLLARRRIREVMVLLFVTMAALPQFLLSRGAPVPERLNQIVGFGAFGTFWPWVAFANAATGIHTLPAAAWVIGWIAAAIWFGRWQFERNIRFDAAAAQSSTDPRPEGTGFAERIFRLPSVLIPGQLGAMVEKEIRFLCRAPRFRLVFIMSFTFGLMIWVPVLTKGSKGGAWHDHFLTAVMVYGVMLLSEVSVWNSFGFDRSAVQVYFAAPVRFSSVLIAKNLAALIFIGVESVIVTLVCAVLPLGLTLPAAVEAYSVTLVVALFVIAIGNIMSIRNPRSVDPSQSWRRTSAGRVQAFLLLIYVVVALPIALAFGARYAFDSDLAFYLVIGLDLAIGTIVYILAMESAVESASSRKEMLITALSRGSGPVG